MVSPFVTVALENLGRCIYSYPPQNEPERPSLHRRVQGFQEVQNNPENPAVIDRRHILGSQGNFSVRINKFTYNWLQVGVGTPLKRDSTLTVLNQERNSGK